MQHHELPAFKKQLQQHLGETFKVTVEDFDTELQVTISAPLDCSIADQCDAIRKTEEKLLGIGKVDFDFFRTAKDWNEMMAVFTVENL